MNNYYQMLDLSIEEFVNDKAKVETAYNECMKKWQNSKNINEQNKATIHGPHILETFESPDTWKRQYETYKKESDDKIRSNLDIVKKDNTVTSENIESLMKKFKVSRGYVEKIASANGITIGGKGQSKDTKKVEGATLKSIKPSFEGQIKTVQNYIEDLGYRDLRELLSPYVDSALALEGAGADVERYKEAIENLKESTAKLSRNGKKASIKSAQEKICAGVTAFFKDHTVEDYNNYLKFRSINKCVMDLFSNLKSQDVDYLNDEPFDRCVNEVYGYLGNRENAKSIVENFFAEKGIGFSKPLPNIAVCPFCHNRFERANPVQNSCPTCGKSFVVKCPKCGKDKNILETAECDGIRLERYPEFINKINSLKSDMDGLRFGYIEGELSDIESAWPGFPGVSEFKTKVSNAKKEVGVDLIKINDCRLSNSYYAAKDIVNRIVSRYPNSVNSFTDINEKIVEADTVYAAYEKETNPDAKLEILMRVIDIVSDHPKAKLELKKYPLGNVSNVEVNVNINGGFASVNIGWKSSNKPDSVSYHIVRKEGNPPANENDGLELIVTKQLSYTDDKIEEGKIYYYAVYASRGPILSNFVVCSNPALYLKPVECTVIGKSNSIEVTWPITSVGNINVFYSTSAISTYKQGNAVSGVSVTGCTINGVSNGTNYYVGVYKSIVFGSREYVSELKIGTATPQEPITPPEFSYTFGNEPGEYILTGSKEYKNLYFYCSDAPAGLTEKSDVSLNYLQTKARLLSTTKSNDGYSVKLNNEKTLYVYPTIVRGTTATLGNVIQLKYVDSIKILEQHITGNKLVMKIEKWPANTDALYLCYREDAYPEDQRDGDRKPEYVTESMYIKNPLLELPFHDCNHFYVSIFAKTGKDFLPIAKTECKGNVFQQKKKIKYRLNWALIAVASKLTLEFEGLTEIPDMVLKCKKGDMQPSNINDGESLLSISSRNVDINKKSLDFTVKLERGKSYKLFTNDQNYILLIQGPSHK